MNLLKRIARRILRDEIRQLEGRARQAEFYFGQWRKAAMLWERYARQLRVNLPTAPSFEEFFWALPGGRGEEPREVSSQHPAGRMSEDTTIPAPPDHCEQCGAEYVNVEHPMKPGVIMQRLCKCEIVIQNIPGGTVTMLVPPKKDE